MNEASADNFLPWDISTKFKPQLKGHCTGGICSERCHESPPLSSLDIKKISHPWFQEELRSSRWYPGQCLFLTNILKTVWDYFVVCINSLPSFCIYKRLHITGYKLPCNIMKGGKWQPLSILIFVIHSCRVSGHHQLHMTSSVSKSEYR